MEQNLLENQATIDPNFVDGQAPQTDMEALSKRVEEIYVSVEKTRKYFLWTLIATVVMFVLPLIGLAFVIPFFLRTLNSTLGM